MADAVHAALTAALDQSEAQVADDLLRTAAKYDGADLHDAASAMMFELLRGPTSRLGLAAGVAVLALRLRRTSAEATDG